MPFRVLTLDELQDFAIALARAVLPTRDWSRRKTGWKFLRVITAVATDLHAHVDAAVRDLLPDTAEDPYLGRWGELRGVKRKPATPARKVKGLRVYGTPSSPVEVGAVLTHLASGLRYQVNEDDAVGALGFVDVNVIALDAGSATRLSKGERLVFDATPAGLQEEAELVLDLDEGGTDVESIGAYRDRILDRFRRPPLGGAASDYEQWSLELTGIATAYVYPLRAGLGSVDVTALHEGRGAARLLSSGELDELAEHLDRRKPVGVSLRVLDVEGTPADVEITYRPTGEPGTDVDWNDSTPLVVDSWSAATRTLGFTTTLPEAIKAGDRIVIKDVSDPPEDDGREMIIEAIDVAGGVVLEEDPPFTPAAGDLVYAGGGLVGAIRDAVLAHFDELGTSNTDANPFGAWEANLRPQNLYRVTQAIPGVRRSDVVEPADTLEPADNPYPDDGTVYLLTPRRVLVRRGW